MRKKAILFVAVLLCSIVGLWAQKDENPYPFYISKDYVVVGVSANTTDKQLLDIRKNILKYSSIRFTNFDVIRGEDGKIYFLSMEIDCRDGYHASISHSFEKGDKSVHGFIRDYSRNNYKRPFYYGDLTSELSGIERVKEAIKKEKEENN